MMHERKTLNEWIKNYRCYNEMVKFLSSKDGDLLNKEMYHFDVDGYFDWYMNNKKYEITTYVKDVIIPEIKIKRKESKKNIYLLCDGEGGYSWLGQYHTIKSFSCRSGKIKKLQDALVDSIMEYTAWEQQPKETLKFNLVSFDEAKKKYEYLTDNTIAINCPKSYWEKIDKIYGKNNT